MSAEVGFALFATKNINRITEQSRYACPPINILSVF